ncbi:MAG: hypothetical protein ABIA37_02520 [Candidatus Woesearchaeota archaeon]
MNKHLKHYWDSFKLKKEHAYTLLVDVVFWLLMAISVILFGSLLQKKAEALSNGQSPEQLQQMLLSMQPEQAQAFLSSLQGLVITFVIGAIIVVVGGLLLFSLSRKLIWDKLLGHKFDKKKYWRWNLLNLVLIIPLVIYAFVFGLLRLLFGYLFSLFKSQVILDAFYNLFNLAALLIFLMFIFLVYYSFSHKYKVWDSIGAAFGLFKKKTWLMFLWALATAIVLSVVVWPIAYLLRYHSTLLIILNGAISVLFIIWLRVYLFRTVKGFFE